MSRQEAEVGGDTSKVMELCLAFVNTVEWHASNHPVESLRSYENLVEWAQNLGTISEEAGNLLRRRAITEAAEATAALERAIALREALYRTFVATIHTQAPSPHDLTILNGVLRIACQYAQLTPAENNRFIWTWANDIADFDSVLYIVAHSAGELLTTGLSLRIKQCEDDRGCGYLFIDTSKNCSRRWCSMGSCGNRAKVQRHRRRTQDDAEKT